jgi:hypothetical protein
MVQRGSVWTSVQRVQLYAIGVLLVICAITSMRNEVLASYGTDIFAISDSEFGDVDIVLPPTNRSNCLCP